MDPNARSIWLVGNAPTSVDRSKKIDRADIVVRFNNAFGFGGVNGSRTTHLFLINCGGQMREWLDDPALLERPHIEASEGIVLPIHPDKDDLTRPPLTTEERLQPGARNYAFEARSRFENSRKSVTLLSATLFEEACRTIGYARPQRDMQAPSTGLIALHWLLRTFDDPIDVTGFGFDGWSGHRWDKERAFFASMEERGRLCVHPVD